MEGFRTERRRRILPKGRCPQHPFLSNNIFQFISSIFKSWIHNPPLFSISRCSSCKLPSIWTKKVMEIPTDRGSEPLLPIPVSTTSNSTLDHGNSTPTAYSWLFECHGFWYKLFLIVPSLLFVLYLAFRARKSLSKLSNGRSYIIVAYYGTLWIVTLLNFAWCMFQVLSFY